MFTYRHSVARGEFSNLDLPRCEKQKTGKQKNTHKILIKTKLKCLRCGAMWCDVLNRWNVIVYTGYYEHFVSSRFLYPHYVTASKIILYFTSKIWIYPVFSSTAERWKRTDWVCVISIKNSFIFCRHFISKKKIAAFIQHWNSCRRSTDITQQISALITSKFFRYKIHCVSWGHWWFRFLTCSRFSFGFSLFCMFFSFFFFHADNEM